MSNKQERAKNGKKVDELEVDMDALPVQKNTDGHLGPKCNNCAGFGYTLVISGPSKTAGCVRCDQTGVEPISGWELQKQVIDLAEKLEDLKKIIIKFAGEKLKDEPKEPKAK